MFQPKSFYQMWIRRLQKVMNKILPQNFDLKKSYGVLIFQITYALIKHFNVNIYYSSFNSYTVV